VSNSARGVRKLRRRAGGNVVAIDWKKELDLNKRIYFWYMKTGLISIPFGLVYACISVHLGHDSTTALIICVAASIITVYKIQGFPPDK
jgi:hypothetical protein